MLVKTTTINRRIDDGGNAGFSCGGGVQGLQCIGA